MNLYWVSGIVVTIFLALFIISKSAKDKKIKEFFESLYKFIEMVGIIITLIAVYFSYGQSELSLYLSKRAMEKSDSSGAQTEALAKTTNDFLKEISTSSKEISTLNKNTISNLTDMINKLKFINNSLTLMSNNVSKFNTYSDKQLTTLKSIGENMNSLAKETLVRAEEIRKEQLKEPIFNVYYKCDNPGDVVEIYLENAGDISAFIITSNINADGINERKDGFDLPKGSHIMYTQTYKAYIHYKEEFTPIKLYIMYKCSNGNDGEKRIKKLNCRDVTDE